MKILQKYSAEQEQNIWDLNIGKITGKNLESKSRTEVNEMLKSGWVLLHIYTLKYQEDDGTWRERPMAILGLPNSETDTFATKIRASH